MEMEGRQEVVFNPMKKRSCTDVICLLLFVAFIAGWGGVAYVGLSQVNESYTVPKY